MFARNILKCGSPKKQNLSAIGRVLGAAGPAASSEKSQQLVVPSRSYAFEVTGDIICPGFVQGIDHLRDPRLNKGLGFTLEERQVLGIHGLQPARFKSQEEQIELCKISINRYQEDLNKYLYLIDLQDRNERLFFRLVSENVAQMMPIIYTPTVGLACQKFGLIYRRPRGLFITINDKGHVYDVIRNWPEPDVRAIVVTDGERILGLGDLGACGMGIPVGKLALYTALAGIKPHQCLPILIDVGTNNKDLLEDPLYIGLRQKRVVGSEYDEFIDEFMAAVVKKYGQNTLIQFEDFGNHNAFRFLDKYRDNYCTFNDDIQGTAAVAVGGLYASSRLTGKTFADATIMFVGAGEAAIGIADLCCKAMEADGISTEDARGKIWMCDIDGLLTTTRKDGSLEGHKQHYAKGCQPMKDLAEIVKEVKPTILIGASATPGLFTPQILQDMAKFNERPIVFALSNPTSRAECTAEEAFQNTEGRVIFCSGSPFPNVTYNGKTFKPGQGNNAYIFPGVALGVIATLMHHIPDDVFLIAARELAASVRDEDLEVGSLYPPLDTIREVSLKIAIGITKYAYCKGLASTYPEPDDKRKWLEDQLYNFNYESSMPITWKWPQPTPMKTRELKPVKLTEREEI
ncbi:NADP-dependent malic enzyme isoform X2 [Sitodiplosis mosellana]|uniref:NADP-dependent malic enzyme isoform X2 n=1 Tax=Sitodiplosis mosellana TaxID=263140 RepID=UPI00244535C0|nr:NADP-dependent malic enzyme isoform X2 [Sitodiplosis mosellana]XP_055295555.1 NADP-dependent malic enzyme isoform X2 [Sitodiplosis mosellana]XP_055295556.1 NADP-dependent malic enzyme isoform X2 [Sitodiplosis mosellana]XP_055295557.1 NADP-dependent malic enzyme isoform X2 [Sitodiplosis mosellana]